MKKMKKLFAMLLAFTMVLGMTMTASAETTNPTSTYKTEDVTGTKSDRGTITVSGIVDEAGITVEAYQIIRAKYEYSKKFSGYESLYDEVIVKADGSVDMTTITDENMTAILAADKVENTTYGLTESTETPGTWSNNDVPVGTYLVNVKGAEGKIYSSVIVSTAYVNIDGTNGLQNDNLAIENGLAWTKVQDNPTIDKNIVVTNDDGTKTNVKGNTVKYGDVVAYEIVTDILYYGGDYPVYNVVDTLTGLEYKDGLTVTVVDGQTTKTLEEGTDYTVTPDLDSLAGATTITLDFVLEENGVKNNYTLNDYEGGKLHITYNAIVTDEASLNENENTNEATLNYTHDSKVNGNDGEVSKTTYTYSFDVDFIKKVAQSSNDTKLSVALSGAEFKLYTDLACTTGYENSKWDFEDEDDVITSSSDETTKGFLYVDGLDEGTYYLKETKAPTGYTLNGTVYKIEITGATYETTGELKSWTVTVTDMSDTSKTTTNVYTIERTAETVTDSTTGEEVTNIVETVVVNKGAGEGKENNENIVDIPNTKIIALPSTGGIGTTIFTVAGCGIMIAAAFFFFASRKKENE